MTVLAAVAVQSWMTVAWAQDRPLRIRGTVVYDRYLPDGKSLMYSLDGNFAFDIDPSGKWFMETECTQGRGTFYQMGFDGQITVELKSHLGVVHDESDTNKTVFVTPETSAAYAKVYAGSEYPIELMQPSKFAWMVLASFEYHKNTNRLGRMGDLFGRMECDPFSFALKLDPQFRKDWPHVLEKAEIFFDIDNYPKDPIGLDVPNDEGSFAFSRRQWETLRLKKSGVRVGFVESSHPIAFREIVMPSQYRLVVSHRSGESPDWDPNIDNRSDEILLKILAIEEAPKVRGLPEIVSPIVVVRDYRFRKMDETTAMEYLTYPIKDKRWKLADDPVLVARSRHNMTVSDRFGNTRNRWVKWVGTGVLILVFFLPLIRVTTGIIQKTKKQI